MKKYIKYIVILIVVVVAVVLFVRYKKAKSAPEWKTDSPSRGAIREVVTATGSLNPYVMVNVGTEVSGKIEKLYKEHNDKVRKGELLAKLDTELLDTALEVARSDLAKSTTSMQSAKLDYDLQTELFAKDMASEYDKIKAQYSYETAQQNLANSQLNLQRAEKNLSNAHITSPIDGVIVSRAVDEGQTVAASLNSPTLYIIANNLDKMQITAGVDEADIGKIKLDMPVEFTVDAHPNQLFHGVVQQIRLNPVTESNVVTYHVIIDATNDEGKLLPGMTTNVTFILNSNMQALRIPETATRFRPSKETWELFGLKWDDEILMASRNVIQEAMAAQQSKSEKASAEGESPARGSGSGGGRGMGMGVGAMMGAGGGSKYSVVWVLKDNVPQPKAVKTGISDGAYVELLDELTDNTVLVTGVKQNDSKKSNTTSGMGPGMRRF